MHTVRVGIIGAKFADRYTIPHRTGDAHELLAATE